MFKQLVKFSSLLRAAPPQYILSTLGGRGSTALPTSTVLCTERGVRVNISLCRHGATRCTYVICSRRRSVFIVYRFTRAVCVCVNYDDVVVLSTFGAIIREGKISVSLSLFLEFSSFRVSTYDLMNIYIGNTVISIRFQKRKIFLIS